MLAKIFLILLVSTLAHAKVEVVNLANNFLAFWENTKEFSSEQKLKVFHQEIVSKFPLFYTYRLDSFRKMGLDSDKEVLNYLNEFSGIAAKFSQLTKEFPLIFEKEAQSFSEKFKDFNSDFSVYLIHSLDEMDGGVRLLGDKEFFIFGLESMIKYQNFSNKVPFIHHELFHQYHFQKQKSEFSEELWQYLWIEGLATYMAHMLNPSATYIDIGLDVPVGLVSQCEKNFLVITDTLLSAWESKSGEDYAKFFSAGSKSEVIPPRAGYYFGYLLAREMSKLNPELNLVDLRGDSLKNLIRETLLKLRMKYLRESHI